MYNKEYYIERAIDSVLSQTVSANEILVVNDGSTDGGELKIRKYGDPRILLINQKNSGESSARNKGIELSTGELIAFLDADDAWKPRFLEAISNLRQRFPNAGIYATAYEIMTTAGIRKPKFYGIPKKQWIGEISYFRSAAFGDPPVSSTSVAIPKKVFEKVGVFAVGKRMGPDGDMWGRIVLNKYPVVFDSEVAATYYTDAINRACNQYFPTDGHPFIDTCAAYPYKFIGETYNDLSLYLLRLKLADARNYVLNKNFKKARSICNNCSYLPFIKKRLIWTTKLNILSYYLFKLKN